jgi:hypothetical protein
MNYLVLTKKQHKKKNMKTFKILLLTLAIMSFGLKASSFEESADKGLIIKVWNHDIGPVKDGAFLSDQIFAHTVTEGKMPGSGLFRIPYALIQTVDYPYINEEGLSSLHNLQIHVEVSTRDGKKSSFLPKLALPGECVEIPTGLNYFKIEDIKITMKSPSYGFSTGAGGMWIARQLRVVSNPICFGFASFSTGAPVDVVAYWPTTLAKNCNKALLNLALHEDEDAPYQPMVTTRDMLDPNWKKTVGLHVDYRDGTSTTLPFCYPTDDLNRENLSGNGVEYAKDISKLGDDFRYYAGHALDADLFGPKVI